MASPAQILANRLNAQKSSGPRSAEGKAVSRFNALKHAASAKSLVIPGEDENALAELSASYYELFQPAGPEEALLVEKIVTADWTQRRMHRLEAEVLNAQVAQQDDSEPNPVGAAYIKDCEGSGALLKIYRCREAAGREWYRALREIRQLQACRADSPPQSPSLPRPHVVPQPPAPEPRPPAAAPWPELEPRPPEPSARRIGFVFDDSAPPAWRL